MSTSVEESLRRHLRESLTRAGRYLAVCDEMVIHIEADAYGPLPPDDPRGKQAYLHGLESREMARRSHDRLGQVAAPSALDMGESGDMLRHAQVAYQLLGMTETRLFGDGSRLESIYRILYG